MTISKMHPDFADEWTSSRNSAAQVYSCERPFVDMAFAGTNARKVLSYRAVTMYAGICDLYVL